MGDVLTIETPRLLLRPLGPDDFESAFALWNEPQVYRFISGKPSSREDIWRGLLRHVGQWQIKGFGYWAAVEKTSDNVIGECGFGDFRREMTVAMDEPEMGWAFASAHHGKGFATEALRVLAAWGDAHLGVAKTACIIAPENAASIRVAEKLGFVKVADTDYKNEPTLLFHRARGVV
jgi:RimJ/RimL family protein N-acetyltransferase